ncbi:hypothetical protein L6164_011104 [Bauhinia variegata]|uniref:Uncharacterized protein n=1 Tax=Bauhinia variegata TaxID=167791 RepID=A0ACB9P637_BAUVA|nr:hypothetical protein L6164_011104 [Bauhinia variegata]
MAGGRFGEMVGIREEVIKRACILAFKAHKSSDKTYLVEKSRSSSSQVIISFPGSWCVNDWFSGKPFGETKIDLEMFPSLRSVSNDEAALVNQAFLRRFQSILTSPSFQSEVQKAVSDNKRIVFTGHSSGAPIAILATLWALDKCRSTNQISSLFCVTFGSPLIGNFIFSHATRRENWSRFFVHFVLRYDIVPRIFLAPLSIIEENFAPILQLLIPKSQTSTQNSIVRSNVTSGFYVNVMRNAATVTSHAACTLMGSTNLLLETATKFIDLSPYRPFGTYVFCTGNGKMVVLRNADAVLQLMFYTAQLTDLAQCDEVARISIRQHLAYESELDECLGMQNVAELDSHQLEELPLSSNGSNGDVASINTALNDLGVSTRARLCLGAAGQWEKHKSNNEGEIHKKREDIEKLLTKIIEYKSTCEIQKVGYYDAFKVQKDSNDFHANVNRLKLVGLWDEIIELLKRYELPDEFEGREEWVELATRYRRLLEPLDIANYYRHLKHEDTGPYMFRARPKRYRFTQRWLEHAKRLKEGACSESCFWAEAEELCCKTNKNVAFQDIKAQNGGTNNHPDIRKNHALKTSLTRNTVKHPHRRSGMECDGFTKRR